MDASNVNYILPTPPPTPTPKPPKRYRPTPPSNEGLHYPIYGLIFKKIQMLYTTS